MHFFQQKKTVKVDFSMHQIYKIITFIASFEIIFFFFYFFAPVDMLCNSASETIKYSWYIEIAMAINAPSIFFTF